MKKLVQKLLILGSLLLVYNLQAKEVKLAGLEHQPALKGAMSVVTSYILMDGHTVAYGKMGNKTVQISQYSQDARAVVYHPDTWGSAPTPVVFFGTGWGNTNHENYHTLLAFIASHGYSVVYVPDSGSYWSQFTKFDNIVNEFSAKLDTSKIGVLGHSSGGGITFKILEHMIANEYGKDGRFLLAMDPYFAQFMDKRNLNALNDTNVLFVQFGPSGNSTDARIPLTTYKLLSGENIDKNYMVLADDNDHGYPSRQNINNMQGLLQPLDALLRYTFVAQNDAHHVKALEGPGKLDPYADAYQKVLAIGSYQYSCEYVHSNGYHKGSDGVSLTTINNCGEPEIGPN